MTRIAFVDNQREDLAPLRAILSDDNTTVETFRDGQFALDTFQRRMPDLVVINLPTSKIDGVTLIDRIRATSIIPVIMLSAVRDEIDEIMGLRFGADDYIHLPVSSRLLAERIKALLRRHAALLAQARTPVAAEKALVCGDLMMDPSRHSVCWKNSEVSLTATEFHMLRALVRRPGIVKTRDQLITASYPDEGFVEDRTIDSHIKRIRKKLKGIDPDFSCIQTLYGVGYRFTPPPTVVSNVTVGQAVAPEATVQNMDDIRSSLTPFRGIGRSNEPAYLPKENARRTATAPTRKYAVSLARGGS
jgi:two-component system response regulator ChvI